MIRHATLHDLKPLARLFDKYRIFYHRPSDPAAAENFLKMRLTNRDSAVFVAFDNEVMTGFAQLYPIFSSVSLKPAWLLNDLYVDEGGRRKGIAALLLEEVRKLGMETSSPWILLQTAADNHAAQAVYKNQGWVKETDFFYRLDIPEK